jgi:hypothetical protein
VLSPKFRNSALLGRKGKCRNIEGYEIIPKKKSYDAIWNEGI